MGDREIKIDVTNDTGDYKTRILNPEAVEEDEGFLEHVAMEVVKGVDLMFNGECVLQTAQKAEITLTIGEYGGKGAQTK